MTATDGPAVAAEPARPATTASPAAEPAAEPAARSAGRRLWEESERPTAPAAPAGQVYSRRGQAVGRHLVDVHDHLRGELSQVRDLLEQVKHGQLAAGAARGALSEMTMRQHNWTLGAYCAAYCTMLTGHHHLEDTAIFPHLRRSEPGLAPVIDRLEAEHLIIHEVVEGVDRALVRLIGNPGDFTDLQEAIDVLTDALLSHLAYEEGQIIGPLSRHGFYAGQV